MVGAVDIGGTKTLLAVFDEHGKIIHDIYFETPREYPEFLAKITEEYATLGSVAVASFAVAVPGKIDREQGLALYSPNLPWKNVALLSDLEDLFQASGTLENDAKAAALSEARLVSKSFSKVLYLTISTGIGGGLIINGIIDHSFQDIEVGHMLLEHNGKLQRWEDFASGKAIVAQFGKKAADITDKKAWAIIADNIALGLIDVVANLTPDLIIIGGGAGSHLDKFKDLLDNQMQKYSNKLLNIPPIVPAKHPEKAVIYGCFQLAKDKSERPSK